LVTPEAGANKSFCSTNRPLMQNVLWLTITCLTRVQLQKYQLLGINLKILSYLYASFCVSENDLAYTENVSKFTLKKFELRHSGQVPRALYIIRTYSVDIS